MPPATATSGYPQCGILGIARSKGQDLRMFTGATLRNRPPRSLPMHLLRTWIPSRLNRFIWTLMAILMGVFSLVGPVTRALLAAQFTTISPWRTFAFGMVVSLVSLFVGMGAGGWLLHRWSFVEMTPRRQLVAVLVTFGADAFARILVTVLLGTSYRSGNTGTQLAQLVISAPIAIVIAVVVLYAGRRERELEVRYDELLAAHVALMREEEDVRARIFDELHGSAQARIVEARIRAQAIASNASEVRVREDAAQLDHDLLDLYQSQIGRMARTLYPAGLEVSLLAAIQQLAERNQGVICVECMSDALVSLLDDPMAAGLHRELRLALYRVIEECVTNAIRHGGAEVISIELSAEIPDGAAVVHLAARNSFTQIPSTRWGHGLTRMNQRVTALGGKTSVEITDSEYIVRVAVPTSQPPLLAEAVSS